MSLPAAAGGQALMMGSEIVSDAAGTILRRADGKNGVNHATATAGVHTYLNTATAGATALSAQSFGQSTQTVVLAEADSGRARATP